MGCQQLKQSGLKNNLSGVLRVMVYYQLVSEALIVSTRNLDSGPCALIDSQDRIYVKAKYGMYNACLLNNVKVSRLGICL